MGQPLRCSAFVWSVLWCFLSAGAACAYVTGDQVLAPPNYNTFTPPPAGHSYNDPVFGTTITRVTFALATPNSGTGGYLQWIENEYSTASPFNIDNTRLLLVFQSYFGLFDGQGNFLKPLPFEVDAHSEPRWSRREPSVFYYHNGNQLKLYDVSTNTAAVVHTFSEYASIAGNGEMDISYDGDHLVLVGDDRYVFIYEISTDTKSPEFDTGGYAFDAVYIAANNCVTISWNQAGTGRYTGIELFDNNMNFIRQLTHAEGHMHMSQDVNGDPVLVWVNAGDPWPACGMRSIVKVRLSDGRQTCLLALDWSLAAHISAADNTWVFAETYAPSNPDPSSSGWVPYANELLQIKLDGSEVRRLAHHRSRPFNLYNYQPKISVSRDGSRFVYSSNYDLQSISGYPTQYSDVYLVTTGTTGALGVVNDPHVTAPVSGAGFAGAALAPAMIASIFGANLAPSTASAPSAPLPTTLAGVTVRLNGVAAPLFYVSPLQVNFQVPWELRGQARVPLSLSVNGVTSTPLFVATAAVAPGLFSLNQQGSGQGAILIAGTASPAAPVGSAAGARPVRRGEFISIFCTGLGAVTSQPASGAAAPSAPLAATASLPSVSIGGLTAAVGFSGLAPGYVGLYQVNVQVPPNAPTGDAIPVVLAIGGAASNTVTMAIQ